MQTELDKLHVNEAAVLFCQVLIGTPDRALRTAPTGIVELRQSSIPGAGLGAFATTFIPRHTWLGEYEGEFISAEEAEYLDTLNYAWKVNTKLCSSA